MNDGPRMDELSLTPPGPLIAWGEAARVLAQLPDASLDALVCDPPAGIALMGKGWDRFQSRDHFVGAMATIFTECHRVLKDGAWGLVWALPKTSHWTAWALEEAGFLVTDVCHHAFAQGFPKGLNVEKALRAKGNDALADRYPGTNTTLKPAIEHWLLVQKPIPSTRTITANVELHGTGALNIDACRPERAPDDQSGWAQSGADGRSGYQDGQTFAIRAMSAEEVRERLGDKGRWPANLVISHTPECRCTGASLVKANGSVTGQEPSDRVDVTSHGAAERLPFAAHGNGDGTETVLNWSCAPDCPVALLNLQSGFSKTKRIEKPSAAPGGNTWGGTIQTNRGARGYTDQGGAARYFNTFVPDPEPFVYVPKPTKKERAVGLPAGEKNEHPTVKSVALMRHWVRLITPPAGIVLDPFMGTGTTGVAALLEGRGFVGVEQEPDSFRAAAFRLAAHLPEDVELSLAMHALELSHAA